MKKREQPLSINIPNHMLSTIGLTMEQQGAFMLCLMKYWKKGGPLDEVELKSICGHQTERIKGLFTEQSGLWRMDWVDEQLAAVQQREESFRVRSLKGVEARRKKIGLLPP